MMKIENNNVLELVKLHKPYNVYEILQSITNIRMIVFKKDEIMISVFNEHISTITIKYIGDNKINIYSSGRYDVSASEFKRDIELDMSREIADLILFLFNIRCVGGMAKANWYVKDNIVQYTAKNSIPIYYNLTGETFTIEYDNNKCTVNIEKCNLLNIIINKVRNLTMVYLSKED